MKKMLAVEKIREEKALFYFGFNEVKKVLIKTYPVTHI